ncbi:MAG: ABC transporter permease [Candidatus Sericytochromatia bacterium]|nr:ABC transporter permease [Candidatus Tanganyikabacteria bacterium]
MEWRETLRALRLAGSPQALLPVVVMMATIGGIAALQGVWVLQMFGADRLLSGMLAQVTVRDMAPTMSALMLAAQIGTAFAGELGAMQVTEEEAALRAMGVDPVRFLVVPRVVALTVVAPIAAGLGAVAALGSGYLGAVFVHGASAGPFLAGLAAQISPAAVAEAIWKAGIFGFLCGLLSCFHGMRARGGAEGVGRAVNAAIVQSIVVVAAAEAALTTVLLRVQS